MKPEEAIEILQKNEGVIVCQTNLHSKLTEKRMRSQ